MDSHLIVIVVLLNDHHRRAVINGQKTDAWTLLCSVFQGCPLAPQLYAIACEFEGRLQIADPRVVGMTPPRPCDLLTDWCADIIAARFADDTQNVVWTRSLHPMLDNHGICMVQRHRRRHTGGQAGADAARQPPRGCTAVGGGAHAHAPATVDARRW